MCGLTGIFNLNGAPIDHRVLTAMNRTLYHRGPDDEGLVTIDTARGRVCSRPGEAPADLGLASRRLAIQDLTPAGRMPMADPSGAVWLVFNGEIYNFVELRKELESAGHVFRTGTDTEVIIRAYEAWGPDCQKRFNGMWALALFDTRTGELFCSRDRFGIKPFYYYFNGQTFVFGSEIKALLAHPDVPCIPDPGAMFNYLARSYRFVDGHPTTFFKDIYQIEPGSCLRVTSNGLKTEVYWRIDPRGKIQYQAEKDYQERYLELLSDSVRLRLRSDVPVACQLSGGLDSSAVAVLAAGQCGLGLPVFSACYEIKPFDEREYIQPTIDQIRAKETFVFPKPADLPETLPVMIRHFDEPVCTVTFFAHWQVMSEVKRQGYKVILNGHGADESAAGYYDHFLHHFGDLRRAGETALLDSEVAAWLDNHGRNRHDQLEHYFSLLDRGVPYMKDYLKFFTSYEAALGPELRGGNGTYDSSMDIFDSLLANRLHRELCRETLPAVLKAEDRTTMAHSIESRLPFLDYRLVEYLFSVPNNLKIQRGLGKYIQRRALKGVLPEAVRTRKEKVGFNAPSEHWFRHELKDYFENMVSSAGLFERGLLDRDGFQRVWSDHQSGRTNHYQFLWQVINLEIWLREYFG